MRTSLHGMNCGDSCCLQVKNLRVQIGQDRILEDVNLHIHCGELMALIGPNGAGKSTFIKAILGQQDHEGTIVFSTPGQRGQKPKIGYVPQSPAFDPGDPVSVADLFACCMSRRPAFFGHSKAMEAKVLECLDRVHGRELMHKRVGTLSGGELQRVLLALALEPIPNLLILDEPLSGVDVEGQTGLMDMLDEIRNTYDLSVLMTTHDFSMLEKYADQVALIDHRVLKLGTPAEVLASEEFRQVFHYGGGGAK
ncbi:MAG: metal ABC transporter ATP-binding protein [Ruminococcaceae bacterium]|nr:metal ABC transporter ATP-binding protein [Oscillospiraceae bacterium]